MEPKKVRSAKINRISNPPLEIFTKVNKKEEERLMKELIEEEKVDHPSHYQGKKFEVIDIIEDFELGFNLGNAIKYILRSGKKNLSIEDLKKSVWYLQREISNLSYEE